MFRLQPKSANDDWSGLRKLVASPRALRSPRGLTRIRRVAPFDGGVPAMLRLKRPNGATLLSNRGLQMASRVLLQVIWNMFLIELENESDRDHA